MAKRIGPVRGVVVAVAVLAAGAFAAAGEPVPGEIVGVPVTLKAGITETVEQLMERERLLPPYYLQLPRPVEQELEADQLPREDPNAPPPLSHWPPIPESYSAASVGPPNLPQTVGTNFKAAFYSEGFWIPPDSMGDIGPTQIVIQVNGRIKVFDKAGTLGPLNVDSRVFWPSVNPPRYPGDPQVRYDRLSGRWFLSAVTFDTNINNNDILLAVSSGPIITGTSSFTFYTFTIGAVSPPDAVNYCDYPSLGVDASALYIGCNMYTPGGAYQYSNGLVIRKSSAVTGGPLVVTVFSPIAAAGLAGPFSPRGVDNDDPSWTEGYFIGTDLFSLSAMNLRRISDPGGTPTLSPNIALAVSHTNVVDQQALGSVVPINSLASRPYAASMHKNKITGATSLWTSLTIETDATCTPANGSGFRRLGAKWYEIGSLTGAPTITQFGTLCTTGAGVATDNSQRGFLYPTAIGSGQGHMALGVSFASASEFVGIAAAGRLRTDPLGGTRAPETIVTTGLASYQITDGIGRNRWGDYSFTDVDPNDDQTIWTFQEYADTPANNWSVRAIQLKAPPPPNLLNTSNPVCVGVASAPVTINGSDQCAAPTCTNGLCTGGGQCPEFFDPGPDTGGPGYANHLTATVTGGITVNSANIVIPAAPSTHRVINVALSLNTTAATTGIKTVSIVNPDGQGKSAAIISVIANRVPVSNPGGPYSVCLSEPAALNGGASTDPDASCGDSIVSYDWDLDNNGTFDVTGATPTVTAAQLSALGLGVGPHTIKLRVTDTHSSSNTNAGTATLTILADGAGCSDANACTQSDACVSGVCTGANPVVCAASDACHIAGTCDVGTGLCSNPTAPDGTPCSDGNPCTGGDTCGAGACSGVPISGPGELQNARFSDKTTFVWDTAPDATRYDVLRGELASLPVGPGGDDEVCFDDQPTTTLVDATTPPPGIGYWYVTRGESSCGDGSYGTQHDGTPRTTTTCP